MSITLHPKYGVNPSLMLCFFCGEASGVALLGANRGQEAPRQAVYDKVPCSKCKELMAQGVMLISVKDGAEGDNPYRTGRMCVIKDEAIRRMVQSPELADEIIRKRVAFIPDAAWAALGLPL